VTRGRWFGAAAAGAWTLLVLACGGTAPPPEPAPQPAPAPEAAPAPAPSLAPRAAAGTYRLRTEIERRGSPQRAGARRGRGGPPETTLRLNATPSAAPVEGAAGTPYIASIMVPGYTQAPRGRTGQAAAWWPVPGDTVVVQWTTPRGQILQLRGQLRGATLAGDVWFVSPASGATFQMGTFSATKSR